MNKRREQMFDFIHSQYPHLYHHSSDIAGSFQDILDTFNTVCRQRDGVRTVLAKQSLSTEQKLTFIQAIMGEPDETLHGAVVDITGNDFNRRVFNALWEGDDLSILDEIE